MTHKADKNDVIKGGKEELVQQLLSHCLFHTCYLINLSKSTCIKPNSGSPPFKSAAPKSSPSQLLTIQSSQFLRLKSLESALILTFLPLISSAHSVFKLHFQHCHHLGLNHHHLSRGLLQKNPNKSPSLL